VKRGICSTFYVRRGIFIARKNEKKGETHKKEEDKRLIIIIIIIFFFSRV
jgi:hypothetical protein